MQLTLNSELFDICHLVSSPRSANTWLRYCIEVISDTYNTGLLEEHPDYFSKYLHDPNTIRLVIDGSKPNKLLKSHYLTEERYKESNNAKMILVIRDYKELIIRYSVGRDLIFTEDSLNKNREMIINKEWNFFNNLRLFDEIDGDKLLIYYEDVMDNPKDELTKILNFLDGDIDLGKIDDFIKNYDAHKKISINCYKSFSDVASNGNNNAFYSELVDDKHKKGLDDLIVSMYPALHSKYLTRYLESKNNTN